MTRYFLSRDADADLKDIVEFIATDSPRAARKVLADLRAAMDRLVELPMVGHQRPGVPGDLRLWSVHSYLVVYRPQSEPLVIVRVLSGYRDLERLLS